MKTFYLFVWVLIGACMCVHAQSSGKVSYIFYNHLHPAVWEKPAELYFSNGKSVFVYDKGKKEGIVSREATITDSNGNVQTIKSGWYEDTTGTIIYKDFKKKSCIVREIIWKQPYLTSEPKLPVIDWKIESEEKKIGNFTAQKAVASFRGRTYTAWFCPVIPVSDGPWKLQGLPGLILEASDEKGEVKFIFKAIEIPYTGSIPIIPPTTGLSVSFEEYKKADDLEFYKMKKRAMSYDNSRGEATEVKRTPPNLLEKEYEQ